MGKIFISYRRDDSASDARSIHDAIARKIGAANVFMDVDNLIAGRRFDRELSKALNRCTVLIAVIGPRWTEIMKARTDSGERDYVREEVAAALKRNIAVIPVRVGQEGRLLPLPKAEELPEDIRELLLHQKHDVTHERFGRDAADLITAIRTVQMEDQPALYRWGPRVAIVALGLAVLIGGGLALKHVLDARTETTAVEQALTLKQEAEATDRKRQEDEQRKSAERAEAKQREDALAAQQAKEAAERQRLAELETQRARERQERESKEADAAVYAAAKQLDSIEAYQGYLTTYPAGAHRAEAEAAIERLTKSDPFDLSQLHPSVRGSVETARRNEKVAEGRAQEARDRAGQAEQVAATAGRKQGTWAGSLDDGSGRYEGQVANNKLHGLGTFIHTNTREKGNQYAGEFSVGKFDGLGTWVLAENPWNTGDWARYEGEFLRGSTNGFGVIQWRHGATYAGGVVENLMSGAGVSRWTDGTRYEGEYSENKRRGYGVMWNSDGSVRQAGLWANDEIEREVRK